MMPRFLPPFPLPRGRQLQSIARPRTRPSCSPVQLAALTRMPDLVMQWENSLMRNSGRQSGCGVGRTGLSERVAALKARNGGQYTHTGHDPCRRRSFVGDLCQMKGNACRRVGMDSIVSSCLRAQRRTTSLSEIDRLNADQAVHGILLQHPVPAHVDERLCFDRISISRMLMA